MKPELHEHLRVHAQWPAFAHSDEHLRFLVLALVGECGELAEHAYSFRDADLRKMKKEIADVGNYTWMVADKFRTTLRPEVVGTPFPAKCDRQLWLVCKINVSAGKLANLVKKDWRGDDGATARRREMLLHLTNLADWLWTLAAVDGVDLYAEMLAKMIEVEQRPAWKAAHGNFGPPVIPGGVPAPECTCVGVCLEAMIAGPHPRHLVCRMDATATPQDPLGDGSFRGPDGAP